MLKLPDVTLVCIETRQHELARMAIDDCLRVAEFGDVLILSDRSEMADDLAQPFHFHLVDDWPEKVGWSRSWWFDVPPLLRTRQTLNVQWDSWIFDPEEWHDEFLEFDYVGSPWWYPFKNVGNGGFSLISSRLKKYIYDRRWDYPCDTAVDDDLLCRTYRPRLEEAGFLWAPDWVASAFAFETSRPYPTSKHFGFHAIYNWPEVLKEDDLAKRIRIVSKLPSIREGGMFKELCRRYPRVNDYLEG